MAKNTVTSFYKDISMEIENDEELLWQGKPQKASFVLSNTVKLLPFVLIWLCFDGFAISMVARSNMPTGMLIFVIIFFAFHLLPVWLWIASIVKALREHKSTEYAFTNKRIITRDKYTLTSYYYHTLHTTTVSVSLIDKLFKVGDIHISGNKKLTLFDLDTPYLISQKLQQFIDRAKEQYDADKQDVEYEEDYKMDTDYSDSYAKDETQFISGRYTSKRAPQKDNDEDDEFLDSIMSTINKRDEF